jgi:hypothetical protein
MLGHDGSNSAALADGSSNVQCYAMKDMPEQRGAVPLGLGGCTAIASPHHAALAAVQAAPAAQQLILHLAAVRITGCP